MTQTEAGITGVKQIPQCSCASASLNLSDKTLYPYFFRTVGNVVLFGISLVDWVVHMGWSMFALVYTDDSVGQQGNVCACPTLFVTPKMPLIPNLFSVLSAMAARAESHGIHVMTQIPLYDMNRLEGAYFYVARPCTQCIYHNGRRFFGTTGFVRCSDSHLRRFKHFRSIESATDRNVRKGKWDVSDWRRGD